ncbi:hypothetical protein KW794_02295, partial [Candidatus Saccharibacteria bacterium]|nr:hypothetical protein [Candidatus Saccharibacteria bacterium]
GNIGIDVLPPDVNQSFHEFGVVPDENKIRYGLDAIKNVGHGAAEEILRAREEAGGKFETLTDYCKLVNCRIVNRKALESLVKAGALDSFGSRMSLFNNIDEILNFSQRLQRDSDAGQVGLFGDMSTDDFAPKLKLVNQAEEDLGVQLGWERELLGLYLSHNPLEAYEAVLKTTQPINSISREMDGRVTTVGGCINQNREITTKSGTKMAFISITDNTGELEAVVFPKLFAQASEIWQRDNFVLVKGKVDYSRSEEPKLLVEEAAYVSEDDAKNLRSGSGSSKIKNFGTDLFNLKQRLYIRLEDSQNQPLLLTLKEKLDGYSGDTEVVLVTGESGQKQVIKLPQTISINEQSLRDLASLFGSTNVVVR